MGYLYNAEAHSKAKTVRYMHVCKLRMSQNPSEYRVCKLLCMEPQNLPKRPVNAIDRHICHVRKTSQKKKENVSMVVDQANCAA